MLNQAGELPDRSVIPAVREPQSDHRQVVLAFASIVLINRGVGIGMAKGFGTYPLDVRIHGVRELIGQSTKALARFLMSRTP